MVDFFMVGILLLFVGVQGNGILSGGVLVGGVGFHRGIGVAGKSGGKGHAAILKELAEELQILETAGMSKTSPGYST